MRDYSVNNSRGPKSIRRDASANRMSIVLKARKVLAKDPDASITQIAKTAQLSRATLYRNFKDKDSLIHAVFHYNLDVLEAFAQRISGDQERFFKLLEAIIDHQVNYQSLASRLSTVDAKIEERVLAVFEEPIQVAQNAGLLRLDFDLKKDLMLTLMLIGGALVTATETERKEKAQRAMQLLMQGLRL